MKIFISGASGFVGGHLAERLVQEGHEIKTLVRPSSDCSLLKRLGIDITVGDITEYDSVKKAVKDCEIIYHTAVAKSGYQQCYEVNVRGTENIMLAALELGVRHVVNCSSTRVFGIQQNPLAAESETFKPKGIYAITKFKSEKIVLKYVEKYQLSAATARITRTIGPRNLRMLKLFKDTLNNKVTIVGSGKVYIQTTYIDDTIDGLILCGQKQVAGQNYTIGTDEYQTLENLITTITEIAGVKCIPKKLPATPFKFASTIGHFICDFFDREPEILNKIDYFLKNQMYDISKTKNQLGYCPKVSMHESIERTLSWYRENKYL